MSSHLAFIDLDGPQQARELRVYLNGKGAPIALESKSSFIEECQELVDNCHIVWADKDPKPSSEEVEGVINSLISLIILVPDPTELITSICDKISTPDKTVKYNEARLRVLTNFFSGYNDKSQHRLPIYMAMVKFAGHADLMGWVPTDLKQVREFMKLWNVSISASQDVLRTLHVAYVQTGQHDAASKVMIELLASYSETNASQARDDAHKCVVTSLADPTTFVMDHLLRLKPVQLLEGQLIHKLLQIFVSGNFSDYQKFYVANKEFVDNLPLDNEANELKMRLLTFTQLAETSKELTLARIAAEVSLDIEKVEYFVIEAAKAGMVMSKIDAVNDKVIIFNSTTREFTKENWVQLKQTLETWKANLHLTQKSFAELFAEA